MIPKLPSNYVKLATCATALFVVAQQFRGHSKSTLNPCLGEERKDCVPSFVSFDSKWRSAPQYNISACVIEKSMSTVLAAMVCYLYDPEKFLAQNRSITNDIYEKRLCQGLNEHGSKKSMDKANRVADQSHWTYFTVVRHPIERFLSGFVDKCLNSPLRRDAADRCFGCKDDIECAVDELYSRAMKYSTGENRRYSFDAIHMFPQNWHCNMDRSYKQLKRIHYQSRRSPEYANMVDEIIAVLQNANVPVEHREYIR